jgi:hypothetical protein
LVAVWVAVSVPGWVLALEQVLVVESALVLGWGSVLVLVLVPDKMFLR